jgi:hypothetical protein
LWGGGGSHSSGAKAYPHIRTLSQSRRRQYIISSILRDVRSSALVCVTASLVTFMSQLLCRGGSHHGAPAPLQTKTPNEQTLSSSANSYQSLCRLCPGRFRLMAGCQRQRSHGPQPAGLATALSMRRQCTTPTHPRRRQSSPHPSPPTLRQAKAIMCLMAGPLKPHQLMWQRKP